jgi:Tol biopolymer transport system component
VATNPRPATAEIAPKPPPTEAPADKPSTEAPYVAEASASFSPDGAWVAVTTALFPTGAAERYYTQLRVMRLDGSAAWLPVDEWAPWGLGYTTPEAFQWSVDGRSLYYTNRPVPDGCALFVNGWDLWRLDLETGEAEEVVPGTSLWLALSPDEGTLAYVRDDLVLLDLQSGAERRLTLSEVDQAVNKEVGNLVWSPDGSALLLTVAYDACTPDTWAQSILRVDVDSLTPTLLVDRDPRLLSTLEWPAPNQALLTDRDGDRYWLDPASGLIEP